MDTGGCERAMRDSIGQENSLDLKMDGNSSLKGEA